MTICSLTPTSELLERVGIRQNSYGNAVYDTSSYGPTFGGGHDMYTQSNMQSISFNPSSYEPLGTISGSYDSSFIAGMVIYATRSSSHRNI